MQERWTALEGWTAETRLAEIRQRLDIAHLPDDLPLAQVSGGEQARLLLARALLDAPDVLLLDEPTNHLDAEGAAWLARVAGRVPGRGAGGQSRPGVPGRDGVAGDRAGRHPRRAAGLSGRGVHRRTGRRRPGGGSGCCWTSRRRRRTGSRWEADIARTKEQARGVELTVRSGVEAPHLRRIAKKVAKKAKVRERRLRRQMESVRWIERAADPAAADAGVPGGHVSAARRAGGARV